MLQARLGDFLSQLVSQVDIGVNQALERASNQSKAFVATEVDVRVRCSVTNGSPTTILLANAYASNYYHVRADGFLEVRLRPRPPASPTSGAK